MAASIAKLSIQITTDTTLMVQGFRRAQAEITGFQGAVDSATDKLVAKFTSVGFAVQAVKFAFREIVQGLQFAEREAAKLQDRMVEVGLLAKSDTLNQHWKEFGEIIGAIALPAVQAITKELRLFNRDIAELFGVDDQLAQLRQLEEQAKKAAETAKKSAEQQEALNKKIRDGLAEQRQEFDKLNDRARALRDSVRTPQEDMAAGARELGQLLSENLITIETAERVAAKLAKDFEAATKAAKGLEVKRESNPALQRGTPAEFSARQQRAFEDRMAAAELKKVKAEQEQSNRILQSILQAIERDPKVRLNRGTLK